jgi:hypothetical protein
MKKTLFTLCAFALIGCQSAPKEAPSEKKLTESLPGLAQVGFRYLKCQVKAKDLDESDTEMMQLFTKKKYGRSLKADEIKAVKDYDWTLTVDESDAQISGPSGATKSDSPLVFEYVKNIKDLLLDTSRELSRFYIDLTLDLKDQQPELVSGGYVYHSRRGEVILVNSSFEHIKISSKSRQGDDRVLEANLALVNGVKIPTQIRITQTVHFRKIFFVFDEKKSPPVPTEMQIATGSSDAGSRFIYTFQNCEAVK